MANPNIVPRWKPGESGNPNGRPKGSRSMSTVVRELLEDENFEIKFANGEIRKYPAKIISEVMSRKAASGDVQAATWLVKTGYGDKLDVTSAGEKIELPAVYLPNRKDDNAAQDPDTDIQG